MEVGAPEAIASTDLSDGAILLFSSSGQVSEMVPTIPPILFQSSQGLAFCTSAPSPQAATYCPPHGTPKATPWLSSPVEIPQVVLSQGACPCLVFRKRHSGKGIENRHPKAAGMSPSIWL